MAHVTGVEVNVFESCAIGQTLQALVGVLEKEGGDERNK